MELYFSFRERLQTNVLNDSFAFWLLPFLHLSKRPSLVTCMKRSLNTFCWMHRKIFSQSQDFCNTSINCFLFLDSYHVWATLEYLSIDPEKHKFPWRFFAFPSFSQRNFALHPSVAEFSDPHHLILLCSVTYSLLWRKNSNDKFERW